MLKYREPEITEWRDPAFLKQGVTVQVLHEYQNHEHVSGNKWWKLKYNLAEALQQNHNTLLTFGGAWSNHIYATAAAAKELGMQSIGIIRGEKVSNPVLAFAEDCGMELEFVSRESYRQKSEEEFISNLHRSYGRFYLIPEGGTNALAIKGCAEWGQRLIRNNQFDRLFIATGTGGSMAGLIVGIDSRSSVTGVAVLKPGDFLKEEVQKWHQLFSRKSFNNWNLLTQYHHGGYARTSPELLTFMEELKASTGLVTDHVYTAKVFWAVRQEILNGAIPRGATVLVVHSGGINTIQRDLRKPPEAY